MTETVTRLPSRDDLTRLYSRAEVRASLGWSDEKLRRRLAKVPQVQPSGNRRGQQFTGADIWALYRGGIGCQGSQGKAGSRSTRPGNIAAGTAGTSAAGTSMAGRSRAGSRRPSLLTELLSALPTDFLTTPTVVPLIPRPTPRR